MVRHFSNGFRPPVQLHPQAYEGQQCVAGSLPCDDLHGLGRQDAVMKICIFLGETYPPNIIFKTMRISALLLPQLHPKTILLHEQPAQEPVRNTDWFTKRLLSCQMVSDGSRRCTATGFRTMNRMKPWLSPVCQRPPEPEECGHLQKREVICHGYLPSRVFRGRGQVD
jgi:hypothetical protein